LLIFDDIDASNLCNEMQFKTGDFIDGTNYTDTTIGQIYVACCFSSEFDLKKRERNRRNRYKLVLLVPMYWLDIFKIDC